MANIEKSIDVEVPVRTAYNQWTQFEEFPSFMEGVTSVTQLDDRRLRWQANVGGKDKEWTSEITEQRPDERVAWKSTSGAKNAGVVTFHRLADRKTRVMLQLEYDPEGMVENVGDAVGLVTGRVSRDLTRFKDYIESRQREPAPGAAKSPPRACRRGVRSYIPTFSPSAPSSRDRQQNVRGIANKM